MAVYTSQSRTSKPSVLVYEASQLNSRDPVPLPLEPIYPILPSVPAKAGASGMIHPYPNQSWCLEKKRQRIANSAHRISLV